MCVCVRVCVCVFISWVGYEGAEFSEDMYVLEEGDYPSPEAMGYLARDTAIRSMQTTGHVSASLSSVCVFVRVCVWGGA